MIIVIYLLFILSFKVFGQEWDYDHQNEWGTYYAACNGNHESPINIQLREVQFNPFILGLNNYEIAYKNSVIKNTGHTVVVNLNTTAANAPYLTNSAVREEKFILDSLHFHWGENDYEGSEHSIDGNKHSAELHLVHYNNIYPDLLSARDRVDGLAVLTVFLQLSLQDNHALTPIINSIDNVIHYESQNIIREDIYLSLLLPSASNAIFRYNGSLTTPPCSESATFLLFANPIPISSRQLSKFRQILGEPEDGVQHRLTHNDRNQQPINDRVVQLSTLPVMSVNDNRIEASIKSLISSVGNLIKSILK